MPIDEAALMAAVDGGIAEAAPAPTPAPPEPATPEGRSDEPVNSGSPAGSDAQPASGTDGEGDGAGEGGGDAPAPGDEPADGDGEAGTEVPADGSKPDADKAKEGAAAAGDTPPRAPDPLNDPLPNALKRETKERINTLIGMVKENSTKLEAVTRDRDDLLTAITDTRATPAQYGQALDYLRMVNSPDRADREQALDFMVREVAALARMLGKPIPGVNMLEGHDDLINEVSTGRLSPDRAQEIAAARNAQQYQLREGQAVRQHNEQQQQREQARAAGVKALNELGVQLRSANPAAYAAKSKVLIESLKPVFAKIHPSEWAATFKRAYDALPAPAAPPVTPPPAIPNRGAPAGGGGNTPLRAGNPAGAAAPAPKSLAEAIDFGISQAR